MIEIVSKRFTVFSVPRSYIKDILTTLVWVHSATHAAARPFVFDLLSTLLGRLTGWLVELIGALPPLEPHCVRLVPCPCMHVISHLALHACCVMPWPVLTGSCNWSVHVCGRSCSSLMAARRASGSPSKLRCALSSRLRNALCPASLACYS